MDHQNNPYEPGTREHAEYAQQVRAADAVLYRNLIIIVLSAAVVSLLMTGGLS